MTEKVAGKPGTGFEADAINHRRAKPVKWWAAIGVLFLVIQAYTLTKWIVSGQATRTGTGSTPVPTWMQIGLTTFQWALVGAAVFAAYKFLWSPWRREGHLTLDGMLLIAWVQVYFLQDPIYNYFHNSFSYSPVLWNLGSWTSATPGWVSPNAHLMPEPLVMMVGLYIAGVFPATVFTCWIMRKAKAKWPQLGRPGLIGIAFATGFIIDFGELGGIALGAWHYPGAIRSMSLFPNTRFQFPLYEPLTAGLFFGAASCLRFFRDDRGLTLVERGVDRIRATPRQKTTLRLLACVGMLNVVVLVGYNIPSQYFALKADPWPQDIVKRSYLSNGVCGPGTLYACERPRQPKLATPSTGSERP